MRFVSYIIGGNGCYRQTDVNNNNNHTSKLLRPHAYHRAKYKLALSYCFIFRKVY